MALTRLLGEIPPSQFLERHFLKLPFARPGGCRELLPPVTWKTIENILGQPNVDVLAGREGQPWTGPAPTSPAEARKAFEAGYTIGIRHAEKHDPALKELADDFHRDFLAPIDVHLYCTPAGCPGFGWHYDAEDVFLLQLQGDKEWWLRKNTVNPWPLVETLPGDMRYEREIMPPMNCRLKADDWLYLPAGYWHRSLAGRESISLSVGIRSVTALDAYDFLRASLLTSLRWRQRLPPAGAVAAQTPEELLRQYRELFTDLGQDLARILAEEGTARAFLRQIGRPMT
jgi:ribosomal protein L16 Arg81 hydroxylase